MPDIVDPVLPDKGFPRDWASTFPAVAVLTDEFNRESLVPHDHPRNSNAAAARERIARSMLTAVNDALAGHPPPSRIHRAFLLLERSRAMELLGDFVSAMTTCESAIEECGEMGDPEFAGAWLRDVIEMHRKLCSSKAVDSGRKALERVLPCGHCGSEGANSRCSRCGTRYCGRDCQKAAWPQHKKACVVPSRPRPVDSAATGSAGDFLAASETLTSARTAGMEATSARALKEQGGVRFKEAQTFMFRPPLMLGLGVTRVSIAEHIARLRASYGKEDLRRASETVNLVAVDGGTITIALDRAPPPGTMAFAKFISAANTVPSIVRATLNMSALFAAGFDPNTKIVTHCPVHNRLEAMSPLGFFLKGAQSLMVNGNYCEELDAALVACAENALAVGMHVDFGHVDEAETPLLMALKMRSPALVRRLLAAGADVRASMEGGHGVLHLICCKSAESRGGTRADSLRSYRRRGVECIRAVAAAAAERGSTLEILDAFDEEGWSPLLMAVDADNVEFATVLLDSGASIGKRSPVFVMSSVEFLMKKSGLDIARRLNNPPASGMRPEAVQDSFLSPMMRLLRMRAAAV